MSGGIIGSWDALEDAAEILERQGLVYILTVGMPGTKVVRTHTNAGDIGTLDTLEEQHAENMLTIRKEWD